MEVTFKGWAWSQDRRHVQHTIFAWTRVPPQIAFDYVADFSRHNEWALDEIKITSLTPGPVGLGSKYSAVGRQSGKDWPSHLEVTAYEPPVQFEFTATGGPITSPSGDPHRHEFLFTPKDGGTQIEARRLDPAPPNIPLWLFKDILAPLILTYARAHRVETMKRLQERLDELAATQKSLSAGSTSR